VTAPKVLLACADDAEAAKLTVIAESLGGTCVCVITGDDAITAIKSGSCDLILLEAVRSNEEALAKLRLDPKLGDAPIVMVAQQGAEDRRVRAYELGAADFIQRPFTDEELVHRMKQALELYTARRQLREAEFEFTALRATDAVTGLGNFQRLHAVLEYEFGRAARYGRPLSCAMIADDAIDALLSEHGRAFADEMLARIAKTIRAEMRTIDRVFRIDVAEFVMVFPETAAPGAKVALERILKHLTTFDLAPSEAKPATEVSEAQPAYRPQIFASLGSVPHPDIRRAEDLFRACNIALELARKMKVEPWPLVEFQRFA
jgi:diguanylate cyclase (GGDEF)-like protein